MALLISTRACAYLPRSIRLSRRSSSQYGKAPTNVIGQSRRTLLEAIAQRKSYISAAQFADFQPTAFAFSTAAGPNESQLENRFSSCLTATGLTEKWSSYITPSKTSTPKSFLKYSSTTLPLISGSVVYCSNFFFDANRPSQMETYPFA